MSQAVFNLTALNISWNSIQCRDSNGAITGYVIAYTGAAGTMNTINVPSNETSVVITNLISHSQYSIRVAARNIIGIGPFSDPILTSTTTGTLTITCMLCSTFTWCGMLCYEYFLMMQTGPIHSLTCATVNRTSITLVWARAHYSYNSTNSTVQLSYTAMTDCIVTSDASGTRVNTSQNYAVIAKLTPQTCYQFNVSLISGNYTESTVMCRTTGIEQHLFYV